MGIDAPPDPALVARLVAALRAGEAVVVPTDTIYGVAVCPAIPGATAQIFALKDRPPATALAVLVASPAAGLALLADADPDADVDADSRPGTDATHRLARLATLWPGPLTVVGRRAAAAAAWDLGGDPTSIGVRCPDHALVRAVAAEVGPLATTSANRHGEPTPPTAAEAAAALTGPVAVIADGGRLEGAASTVVDARGAELQVLREGPLGAAALRALAEGG